VANALERSRLSRQNRQCQQILEAQVRAKTADVRSREDEIALRLISATGIVTWKLGSTLKESAYTVWLSPPTLAGIMKGSNTSWSERRCTMSARLVFRIIFSGSPADFPPKNTR